MSKKPAIGLTYWEQNKDKIKKNFGIIMKIEDKVKQKPLPRYFKKKWENENLMEITYSEYENQKQIKENIEKTLKKIHTNNPQKTYLEYLKDGLQNRAKYLVRNEI